MKKIRNLSVIIALLLVAVPLASKAATTFFADYFTNSSTLNQPFAAPTLHATSYQTAIGITNATTIPNLSPGHLTVVFPVTGSVLGETLALFTNSPVALSEVGDYLEIKVAFVNASNIMSGLATGNSTINIGLFNSGGIAPTNQGQFMLSSLNGVAGGITGGTEDWIGYIGRIFFSGSSSIITRPTQTPNGTTSQNQDLLFSNASSSQAFNNLAGANLGSTPSAVSLTNGSTYTVQLMITLNAPGSLVISNALYAGVGTGGPVVYSQQKIATNANFLTSAFDGMAIGWRMSGSSQASAIDITAIEVTGKSTVVTQPPDIITQPVAASVPSGGSCAFWVVSQGFNMTYQWHRYGTNLINGGNISGATSDTLIISPANAADVASTANGYYVTVTGTGNYSTNSTTNSLSLRTAVPLTWTAGGGNVWDLNTTASWTPNGVDSTVFNYGDPVTLDDTAGTRIITLTGKYLSAASVTVDSSDGGAPYNFFSTSTGSFAGPGQLIYKGANQLTIANVNTYSGGTIISNPTAFLVLSNYAGLGSGPVTLAQAGGTLHIVPSGNAISGIQGDIIVQDDFTIQYEGTGAFGAVFFGNFSGTAGKTLTLTPNSLTTTNRLRIYGANMTLDANLFLDGPATSEANYYGTSLAPYNPNGSQIYNGVISGNGGLIQRGAGLAVFAGQNTFAGGTTPSNGTLGFGDDSTPTSGTVTSGPIGTGPLFINPESPNTTGSGAVQAFGGGRTIANPIQFASGTNNQTLVINGTNNLTFTGPCTLNGNDGATTFSNRIFQTDNTGLTTLSGIISGTGFGLIKTGTNILALSANNSYTGRTTISNGTLRVTGSLAGGVTVATNGTLGGSGTVSGDVIVQAAGSIAPGNSIGTLTINNNLALAGNLNIEVNNSPNPSSDKMSVTGTLANSGTGTVTVSNLGPALAPGDTFTLFNKAVTGGNLMTITGGQVVWTNKLAVDGTISVVAPVATTPTNISYSLSGTNLTLSWPQNYVTWSLQSNSVSVASSTNWFAVPSSSTVTQFVVPVNPARSNVFYRLIAP